MHKSRHLAMTILYAFLAIIIALAIVFALQQNNFGNGTSTAVLAAVLTAVLITFFYRQPMV